MFVLFSVSLLQRLGFAVYGPPERITVGIAPMRSSITMRYYPPREWPFSSAGGI